MKILLAITLLLLAAVSAQAKQPNLVLIFIDDMGCEDIGPFGQEFIKTPSLDRMAAGRTVQRAVDLATMPIYVRAGSIVPVDPIRQYTGEKVDEPMTLKIYRGANGKTILYDDDGIRLDYIEGDSVQTLIKWDDAAKTLSLEPASKQTVTRTFQVELIPDGGTKEIQYDGRSLELKF